MSLLIVFVKEVALGSGRMPIGRRERAKKDKHERIMTAARELFAEQGVSGVTTQQIADRADVAIGTLYQYASTKAELLIMAQNEKFAAAIDDGLAAADAAVGQGVLEGVVELIRPVVACVREQIENGRIYLHELVFGDPAEPYRFEEPLHRFQNMIIDRMVGIDRVPAGDNDTMTPMFGPPQTTARDCPISGLFGATRLPSPQVRGHLPITMDGSSTVCWTLSGTEDTAQTEQALRS